MYRLKFVILFLFFNGEICFVSNCNWSGTWHGQVKTYPKGELGDGWNVTFILGSYPLTDETCTIWKKTFSQHETIQLIKDYRLCRGKNESDLYVDEGHGIKVSVQWIDHILITSFKYNGLLTISSMQIRHDLLEEQVIVTQDLPSDKDKFVSMQTKSIHLTKMIKSAE